MPKNLDLDALLVPSLCLKILIQIIQTTQTYEQIPYQEDYCPSRRGRIHVRKFNKVVDQRFLFPECIF